MSAGLLAPIGMGVTWGRVCGVPRLEWGPWLCRGMCPQQVALPEQSWVPMLTLPAVTRGWFWGPGDVPAGWAGAG